MILTVVWLPESENRLAELWNNATDRQTIADAANWIDEALRSNALKMVTRVDDLYFLRRDSLLVLCEIDVDDRVVRVIDVRVVESE